MSIVVIIDDSPSALAITSDFLKQGGYEAFSFLSSREALKFLARTHVDLVVTDIYMPDEDGLEVVLKTRSLCPTIPVIAITAATGDKDLRRAAKFLGAAATLQKPFNSEELLQAAAAALSGKAKAKSGAVGSSDD